MKILYVLPYPPSLIRVRPFQLIRHLTQLGHQVTVAAPWSNEEERADLQKMTAGGLAVITHRVPTHRSCLNCLRALPSRTPLQSVYSWDPAFAQAIQDRLQDRNGKFDAIHVEHLRGARYGLWLKKHGAKSGKSAAMRKPPPPVVWDSVDCISHLFAQAARDSRSLKGRVLTRLELGRTRSYEAWLVQQFDRTLVTSPVDKAAFLELLQAGSRPDGYRARLKVLPNGVDLNYFSPGGEAREAATVVFTGKMSYHANITAVLQLVNDIMPRVWQQRPETQVWIVGKDPPRQVKQLAGHHAPQVTVTGTVPDIRPYLRSATLAVAPVPYGAGIQNKVLEAMACATPVVCSDQAVSALSLEPGRDLLVGEDVDSLAANILSLLEDPARRAALGRNGRSHVETHHSWVAMAKQLGTIYGEAREVASSAFLSRRPAPHTALTNALDRPA